MTVIKFPAPIRVVPQDEKANRHFSYVQVTFPEGYEKQIRFLTRDPDPAKEAQMPEQDRLLYAFVTVNATTGVASEFAWASGRKDVHIVVDYPAECVSAEVVAERAAFIEKLKEVYHDRGFEHGGSAEADCYEGGVENFARNYQQSTRRNLAQEVAAILCGKLAQVA